MASDKERLEKLEQFARSGRVNPWALNPQRLEERWFVYRLAEFFQERNRAAENFHTQLVNGRKDIEKLCKLAYEVFSCEAPLWMRTTSATLQDVWNGMQLLMAMKR